MLLAANIYTVQMQKLLDRWKMEAASAASGDDLAKVASKDPELFWEKEHYRILGPEDPGPACTGDTSFRGGFVIYDWETKAIVRYFDWGSQLVTPSGFCFQDEFMHLVDLEGAQIFTVDLRTSEGRLVRRISHPYFNDVHSLERSSRGFLLTASGVDLVLEIDEHGKLLWQWWAAEHGYDQSPSGRKRVAGRGVEHRNIYYHTRFHTTHPNAATFRSADERHVLALLFHQGQLIQIDRQAGGRHEVVLDGLAHPHGLERVPGGWLLCCSSSREVILLDDDLNVTRRIVYDGGWIQDCTMLSSGNILVNDVDRHRLVELRAPDWQIAAVTEYEQSWRMGELLEMPHASAKALGRASARPAAASQGGIA